MKWLTISGLNEQLQQELEYTWYADRPKGLGLGLLCDN